MNETCNTALKKDGKFCKCELGSNHLGEHEFKIPKSESAISLVEGLVGLSVTSALVIALGYGVSVGVLHDIGLLIGLGYSAILVFSGMGWLVSLHAVFYNLYWSRKPDEIWLRTKKVSYSHQDDAGYEKKSIITESKIE